MAENIPNGNQSPMNDAPQGHRTIKLTPLNVKPASEEGAAPDQSENTSTIKALQAAKRDLSSIITQMAAENCISLKNNRNAVKGENTWTGKMKKLKEMNLRAAENNAFDIETAEGMRQVADISNASIIKQLSLDESDYTDMLVEQRKMLTDLQRRVAIAEEKARLLLRENLDMKEYMTQKELPFEQFEVADRVLDGDFDVPDPEGV